MRRNLMRNLVDWKNKMKRDPLLLLGARQVGKTYLLREFAETQFEDYLYLNFERDRGLAELFEGDLTPSRLIEEIEYLYGKRIQPKRMLIIMDEIQLSMRAVTSLKYFSEEAEEYFVAGAGSLLGVALNREQYSFPVGKVELQYLYPFSFDEFLVGIGEGLLTERIEKSYQTMTKMPEALHQKLLAYYYRYLYIGGMPAAINHYKDVQMNLLDFDRNVQGNIINAYLADMSKYTTSRDAVKVQAIYRSLTKQLAADNRKFKYSVVEKGGKASRFESSLEWLLLSRASLECQMINRPEIPLSAYVESKHFKLYFSDVGLLMNMAQVPFSILRKEEEHNLFKGAIAENYVAQQLCAGGHLLYYWKSKTHKVDFIIQRGEVVIPVEVKASKNKRSRSLMEFMKKYEPRYGIRLSTNNFGFSNSIQSIPLYAAYLI